MIGDGKWHKMGHLKQLVGLNDYEVQEITRFLNQYDFVEIDENCQRIKMDRDFRKIQLTT